MKSIGGRLEPLPAARSAASQERGRLPMRPTDNLAAAVFFLPSEKGLRLNTEPRFLGITAIAHLAGCTPQTIRTWVERGVIPADAVFRPMKRGRFRFYEDRIRAWIASKTGAKA